MCVCVAVTRVYGIQSYKSKITYFEVCIAILCGTSVATGRLSWSVWASGDEICTLESCNAQQICVVLLMTKYVLKIKRGGSGEIAVAPARSVVPPVHRLRCAYLQVLRWW